MERALKDHQDEVGQAIAMVTTENGTMLPEDKIKPIRENSCKIMSYCTPTIGGRWAMRF